MIGVRVCELATKEHRRDPRAYAHTFHFGRDAEIVCIAKQYYDLPIAFKLGVFLHELGHIALKRHKHTEEMADREAERISGVQIYWRRCGRAEDLQCVRSVDVQRAKEFVMSKVLE